MLLRRCIVQSYWIHRFRQGIKRIPNDAFDHLFSPYAIYLDPSVIWDDEHQEFLRKADPIPVHSHNDYERRIPLFEALASGCVSVEADVHLVGGELLVGHSARGLKASSNLRTMYLEPLQRMLEARKHDQTWRGLFESDPEQTVVLLIDHKTSGPETFAELDAQLQPLRDLDFLSYWNGSARITRPLTVVATGKAPFDSVLALKDSHRDIFFDAPLDALPSTLDDFTADPPRFRYNQSNSHYASTQYRKAVTWRAHYRDTPPMTPRDIDLSAANPEQAAARGLLTRLWDAPMSPPNLRDSVWRWQVSTGTGVINMDDMGVVRDKSSGWGRVRELKV